ncbi:MAG TPA: L-dopachrome tautomerase-related protein [Planctomycetota bacterium]|nr:L-dopachrome tautomerase-related protein [Planctomycetota bacterium]
MGQRMGRRIGLLAVLGLWGCQSPEEDLPPRSYASARPPTSGDILGSSAVLPLERSGPESIEIVARFWDAMPTGVTVATFGRIFVSFPRWGDPVPFTVAELKDGKTVPFPNPDMNQLDPYRPGDTFVSVQSVVVDPLNRLWALDTGSIEGGPVIPRGAKLVCIDLSTNSVRKVIHFPPDVALKHSSLSDVRFDLRKGREGTAYITDSSSIAAAILVVDLATGDSRRRLHDHPSTRAEPRFLPFVEGRELRRRPPGKATQYLSAGADGIALGADGKRLYYCPLASRRLYSVDTDALRDERAAEETVAATVRDEGMKPASDGLESDTMGRIYATAYESGSIVRRQRDGIYETMVHDPRVLWPDTLSLADDGYLYFIVNQQHRQKDYTGGVDLRKKPYVLFRVRTDGQPLGLR